GLDDVRVEGADDDELLAFLHLSEKAAAGRFALYRQVLAHDAETRAVFDEVLRDEAFHMSYTQTQLERVAPRKSRARLSRPASGGSGRRTCGSRRRSRPSSERCSCACSISSCCPR